MAMVWQGPKSRTALLSESLGNALGGGLANFTGNYFANQKLEDIMADPQYKDKPLEEKWQALQRGLENYGEFGKQAMQRQLQIDQKISEKQANKMRSSAFNKTLNKQPLTPEEEASLAPEDRLAIAKHEQALEIAQLKANTPKGGASFQAVPPHIAQKMAEIDQANPDATAAERETQYRNAEIPPGYYSTSIETRRREEERKEKTKAKEQQAAINIHNLSKDLDADIQEKGRAGERQLQAIEASRAAIKGGKVTPFSLSNIFRGFGKVGDKLAELMLNKDEATLLANVPTFIEGMKEIFGVRLSDADLRVVQDKLPSIGKSPEANEAIFKIIEKYANKAKNRAEIARDIKKENKGFRTIDFDVQLEDRLERREHPGKTKMRSPNGKTAWVDDNLVDDAMKNGGEIYQ